MGDENVARLKGVINTFIDLAGFILQLRGIARKELQVVFLVCALNQIAECQMIIAFKRSDQKMNDRGELLVIFRHVDLADEPRRLFWISRKRLQIKVCLKIVGKQLFNLVCVQTNRVIIDIFRINGLIEISPLLVDGFHVCHV